MSTPAPARSYLSHLDRRRRQCGRGRSHRVRRRPWPRLTPAERDGYLREMAALLPTVFAAYADMADTFPFVEQHVPGPTGGGGTGLLVQEPVGVVAAIVPWKRRAAATSWPRWPRRSPTRSGTSAGRSAT
jgi:acyl-CoA reductase-like NAD-dependent aldehyde dehydrogenase